MSSAIYYRLAGQGVALALHASNSLVMFLAMQNEELLKDPDIRDMTSLQSRYLTVWNIGFQLAYFSLAFTCDVLTVTGRDNLLPKSLRRFRQVFFASIIFPLAAIIFTLFWPFFIVNRELLFPAFIDRIFSFKSNFVMHFFILPAALWELAFLPRPVPKSHRINIGIITIINLVYNALVLHTHSQRGLFPYPIMSMTYGTVYFPMFLISVFLIGLPIYLLQWKLTTLFWGIENKKTTKKNKHS